MRKLTKTQFFVSPVIGLWLGISVFLFGSPAFANIPAIERAALIALYESTDGKHWSHRSGWKTPPLAADGFSLPGTEGNWHGITCNSTNTSVQGIYLSSNNLNGSLPPELGNLTQLERLEIKHNYYLSGSIPPELGNLNKLESLDLGWNELSGSIPPEMGNLTQLKELNLDFNHLIGSIPPEMGNLINLSALDLCKNRLSGNIPPELGNLNHLKYLSIYGNRLSGSLPPELGNLNHLEVFNLYVNRLSGSLPPELGNLTSLFWLNFAGNHFSGSLPPELGNLTHLLLLDLHGNDFSGSLPPELGNLAGLNCLYLHENNLSGNIPPELGKMASLDVLDLSENHLSGSIPSELGDIACLGWLDLSGNHLSGSLPPELAHLTKLRWFYLCCNSLSGSLPPELGHMKNLGGLDLGWNNLTGRIPPELGHLTGLKFLFLGGNRLSGSIPPDLGNLIHLEGLSLNSNCLSGDIPSSLQNLTKLVNYKKLNICWNALFTANQFLKDFIYQASKWSDCTDWNITQTISPKRVSAAASSAHSIDVLWKPIRYKQDSGGYRVFYSTSARGPFTYFGMTADKYASAMTVTGLKANSTYYFKVQTRTNPHANNRNTVDSVFSGIVSATTPSLLDISGHITYKGSGLAGVSLRLSNNGPIAFTDTNGFYRAMVDHGWSGTVTPVKEHYQFIPVLRTYPAVLSGQTNQDFEAILSLMVTLRAERKTESAFIIRRDYGLLTLTVGNGNQVPGIRYVIERRISGGAYQMIKELTDPDLANGTFVYYDKYLDKDKSYTYRVLAYDPAGNTLSLSSEVTM